MRNGAAARHRPDVDAAGAKGHIQVASAKTGQLSGSAGRGRQRPA
jgi:hypothetical protein